MVGGPSRNSKKEKTDLQAGVVLAWPSGGSWNRRDDVRQWEA